MHNTTLATSCQRVIRRAHYVTCWLHSAGACDAGIGHLSCELYAVVTANTVALKCYDGLKHSGDEEDAALLAHVLRLGILPTGLHSLAIRAGATGPR